MKKIYTFIAAFVFLIGINFSTAQNQIVNQGFENWDNLGSSSEEPQGWNSFMTAEDNGIGGFAFGIAQSQKVERSNDSRPGSSGSYSARIWSTSILGNVANGNMTTGRIMIGSTTPSNNANHNKTKRNDANFHQDFTGNPDSLVVWVKFNAGGGNEAKISATIHDDYDYRDPSGSDPNAPSHVVAKAEYTYGPTGGWTRVSVPFDYNHPATDAQYVLITFTTNKTPGGGAANDEVFIDDLQFIYPPQVNIAPTTAQNLVETQLGTPLSVTENFTPTSREWKFRTTPNGTLQSFSPAQTASTYTPQFASAGTYYVVCESTRNGNTTRSNQVSINVSSFTSSVSPASAQTIFQNQAGIDLTVSESVTADSREWKFSTTSGGPYQSFSPNETGGTYTPLFFNVNTYYIICESTKGGVTTTSNEVEIDVLQSSTPSISITPTSSQSIELDIDGTPLTANETITPTAREWKFSTSAGGPYQSFTPTETGGTYTPNFSVAGTYYIICESTMSGTVYTSNEVEIEVLDLGVTISPDTTQFLYTNLPGDTVFAIETQPATSRVWKYNSQLGAPYQIIPNQTDSFFVPNFEDASYYYVICESNFNGVIKQSDMVTFIVDNGPKLNITPYGVQNFEVGQSGDELTVNAGNFTISSQEWLYSDSLNGTYVSFATPETATNYTPSFSDAGTYYVLCEGIIEGVTFTSNKIKIEVAEDGSVGIYNVLDTDFKVYVGNQNLYIDLSDKNFEEAELQLVNIQGQSVINSKINGNQMNVIDVNSLKGYYFYSIVQDKSVYQGKVFIK